MLTPKSTSQTTPTPAPPRRPSLLAGFGQKAVETWKAQEKPGTDNRQGYHSTTAPALRK